MRSENNMTSEPLSEAFAEVYIRETIGMMDTPFKLVDVDMSQDRNSDRNYITATVVLNDNREHMSSKSQWHEIFELWGLKQ